MGPVLFRSRRVRRLHRWRVPLVVRVLRRPLVWWAATAVVALAAASAVGNLHAEARRNRDAWGETTTVLVAALDIGPGTPIGDNFTVEQWPRELVPSDAIAEIDPTVEAIAAIGQGEPLVAKRLGGAGAGLGARIPPGRAAVAVSAVLIPTGLSVGDHVDLVATFPTGTDRADGVVAVGAVVVDVTDDQVTVAVAPDEVGPTAAAITRGTLTMLVNGA